MDVDGGSAIGAYVDLVAERMPPGIVVSGSQITNAFGDWTQILGRPFLVDAEFPISIQSLDDPQLRQVILQTVDELTSSDLAQVGRYPGCGWGVRGRLLESAGGAPRALMIFLPAEESSGRFDQSSDADDGFDGDVPIFVWETRMDGTVSYVSPSVFDYTGWKADDFSGIEWAAAIHPEDRLIAAKASWNAHRTAQASHFTCRIRRRDGRYFRFFILGVPRHDKAGAFQGFRGFTIPFSGPLPDGNGIPSIDSLRSRLIQRSPYLTSYLTPELRYVAVNLKYAQFWGKTPQAIVGRPLDEIAGEFFDLIHSRLQVALQGKPVSYQLNVQELGTETSWLDITHVPELDESGNVVGVYCFVKEMTRLHEREALLQMVLDHAPAHILLIDTDETVRYANDSLVQTFGIPLKNCLGEKFQTVLTTCLDRDLTPCVQRALSGEQCRVEVGGVDCEGRSIQLLVNLVPHFDGDTVTSVCGLMVDTTELKLAEEKLRTSEARYELAVRGSSVAVWEYDPDDNLSIFCEDIERLLGYAPGELGRSRSAVRKLIHPDDQRLNDAARQLSLDGIDAKVELRMKTRSGQYRWYSVRSRIENDPNGRPKRIAGTLTDVHDLKMAQLRAAQQVRQRDEFLAMLSHELRNPMTAIMFALNCLENNLSLDSDSQEMVEIISRQSNHMKRLLSDLLDVARLTNNRIKFEKSTVDLRDIISELVPAVEPGFADKFQSFQTEIPDEPVLIHADGVRIKQVIGNLLENARKYTPPHGRIKLTVKINRERAVVRVEDNGVGIREDVLESLFDLFYQVEQTRDREIGGMGVGLFLAKKILEHHKGRVFVESRGLNQGSCFGFEIPLRQIGSITGAPQIQATLGELHVALVEDNVDALRSLERLLRQRGCRVDAYDTGDKAVENIPKCQPQVAIIDIGLPGKSGLEVARELRQRRGTRDTLLIALTGYGQQADRDACLAAGFDDHLVKPVDFESLCSRINTHLTERARSRSA